MASNQYKLLFSLLSAKGSSINTGRFTLAAARAITFDISRFLSKLEANEVIFFGRGLSRSNSSIVVTDTMTWRSQLQLLVSLKPFKRVICTESNPLQKLQKRLMVDQTTSLEIHITGNTSLVFSAQVNNIKAIIYWANTAKGCESIQRQKHGLERAIINFRLSAQCIPAILAYCETGASEVLLQTTEISHDVDSREQNNQSSDWFEAVSLAECSLEMLASNNYVNNFAQELIQDVTTAFIETGVPTGELAEAMLRWQNTSMPKNTPIHGDLWHSNALYDKEHKPCGIIDWEWYSDSGVRGFDAIHCLIVSFAVFNQISTFEVIRKTFKKDIDVAPLLKTLDQFVDTGKLARSDINPIICLVWLMIIYRSHIRTGPRNEKWLSDATSRTMPFALNALAM